MFLLLPSYAQSKFVGRLDLSVSQLVAFTREGTGAGDGPGGAKMIKSRNVPLQNKHGAVITGKHFHLHAGVRFFLVDVVPPSSYDIWF